MKIRIFGHWNIARHRSLQLHKSRIQRLIIKQRSKLKKCQGCTLEGLGPGGAPQARGRERRESRFLIKWRIRMPADPAAGSLLSCQAHDPCGEAVPCPQTPMYLLLQKKALPKQWVLRHKKAEWRLGNTLPAGCRRGRHIVRGSPRA